MVVFVAGGEPVMVEARPFWAMPPMYGVMV